MARIFKQTYVKPIPENAEFFVKNNKRMVRFKTGKGKPVVGKVSQDGTKVVLEASNFYIDYQDADRRTKRVPGYHDRKATEQKAAALERDAEYIRSGYKPREHKQLNRPLLEHLEEFYQDHKSKDITEKQALQVYTRVKRVIKDCRFTLWSDISAPRVQSYLLELRQDRGDKRGISHQTSNWYLQAIKAFCNWMLREKRVDENPLVYLTGLNVRTDIRRQRRALTTAECMKLLTTTASSPEHLGMSGRDRALLYFTALESGFRVNEIKTLTVGTCQLDDVPPTLTVKAAYSKNRKPCIQPIPESLAKALKVLTHGRSPDELLFANLPRNDSFAKMLRKDLKAAGIPSIAPTGERVDFHALRHTYVTNLVTSGMNPKAAMDLARHSDFNLTYGRYAHVTTRDKADALKSVKSLDFGDSDKGREPGNTDSDDKHSDKPI